MDSASASVKAIKQQVSRACLSVNKVFAGYYWSYENKQPFKPELDNRIKMVHQFDLNEIFLYEFKSVCEASKITGCNKSSIAKACRGTRNHAGGFIWKYK